MVRKQILEYVNYYLLHLGKIYKKYMSSKNNGLICKQRSKKNGENNRKSDIVEQKNCTASEPQTIRN